VVNQLELISVDGAVAKAYGPIRAGLAQQGTPIGANDLWIAAQALVCGAVLVTANLREFERVEGLSLDNWLA
jgi:tRNA(fMet)-specific endonuclease VapC